MKDTKFHEKHKQMSEQIAKDPAMMPYRYVFVITNQCNLACPFCFQNKTDSNGHLSVDRWLSILDELPEYARVTITGGEPLLHKHFEKIFRNVASRFECNVITNGILLDQTIIDMLLGYPNFKVLSLSIDDIGNKCRGVDSSEWEFLVSMLNYFNSKKNSAILDIKTIIMDENVSELFDIYKYFREELKCDTHVFTFLKGSYLQHSDVMYPLHKVFEIDKQRYIYNKIDEIVEQLNMVRIYNIKHNLSSYCHPKVCSLVSEKPITAQDIAKISGKDFDINLFEPCLFPFSSIHINYDGNVFPCLSVSMGSVKQNSLKEILQSKEYTNFKKTIEKQFLLQGCMRCGWLIPKET